jgi:hypothetical protein
MKTLLFDLDDLDFYDEELRVRAGDPQAQEVIEKEEDECECSCGVTDGDVEPLGGNRFRVLAPVSLMAVFGPFSPRLSMGQIIEAEPVSTGVWRYVRTHFKPAVCSWGYRCERDVLNKPDILEDLQLLQELNCQWEWCAGNITVQKVSIEGEPLLSEVERIIDPIVPKAPAVSCAQVQSTGGAMAKG